MKPELVLLDIPSDWNVIWNNFTQVEPEKFMTEDYIYLWEFQEDIFYFRNEEKRRLLDLGWYPELRPEGMYRLVLIKINEQEEISEDWENPIVSYSTRNINELQIKINWILNEVSQGRV
jgi:hypothetical protein